MPCEMLSTRATIRGECSRAGGERQAVTIIPHEESGAWIISGSFTANTRSRKYEMMRKEEREMAGGWDATKKNNIPYKVIIKKNKRIYRIVNQEEREKGHLRTWIKYTYISIKEMGTPLETTWQGGLCSWHDPGLHSRDSTFHSISTSQRPLLHSPFHPPRWSDTIFNNNRQQRSACERFCLEWEGDSGRGKGRRD